MVGGFKHTEVGVIPNDWKVIPISEITSLMTNGFVGTVKSHYTDYENGILYIQGYNVEENSFNYNGIKRVTEEFHKKHLKSCLQKGDLLTIQTGDIGVTTVVPEHLAGSNCHALIITRFKKGTAEPKFYSYYFNFSAGRRRLKEIETGSTMKHINVGDMIQLLIPYPTKAEQTAIATALNDGDALIQKLEQLIAKKRNIKTGAMQELLKPKEGWEQKALGQIADLYQPETISQEKFTNDGYLVYGANGIVGRFDRYNHEHWQTTITCRGSTCGTVNKTVDKCWITGNAMVANVDRNTCVDKLFFYFLLTRQDFSNCITGSGQPQIVRKPLFEFYVWLPKQKEEQSQIAQILSDMDNEIQELEKQLEKYKMMKQGMMQSLLTGKIRLV